jgi:serine protease inhibitor
MKLLCNLVLLFTLFVFCQFSTTMAEGSLLLEAQADFALQLVRESAPNADKSLIISPVSISIALAMCHAGAGNETALQIAKAIASGKFCVMVAIVL